MEMIVDTSVVIAVIAKEKSRRKIISVTRGIELVAPFSLHAEVGNALSAMFKRKLITFQKAAVMLGIYKQIPIQFIDIDLERSLKLAEELRIYAYDAYMLDSALVRNVQLITLDTKLQKIAEKRGIEVIRI